jgi:hypothetical protein
LSGDLPCLTCPTNILEIVAQFSSTKCALFLALFMASVLALFFALVFRLVCSFNALLVFWHVYNHNHFPPIGTSSRNKVAMMISFNKYRDVVAMFIRLSHLVLFVA